MKILITGGGGFLGFKLAKTLLARGTLGGKPITAMTLLDGAFPPGLGDLKNEKVKAVVGDVSNAGTIASVCTPDTGAVFHLAAVVSGAAEADFDLGMRVNYKGMELLLAQMRKCATPARLVYTSSVAAFGGDLPAVLDDSTIANPQTSYGAQKVIGEYLVSDYSRKGFLDGRSLRLPTIVVRAGKPNAAASSFASGIIREPLNGVVSECPVAPETGVWLLSPGKVVGAPARGLGHAALAEPAGHHRDGGADGGRDAPSGGRRGREARGLQGRRAHPGDREDLAGEFPHPARARDGLQARCRRGIRDPRLHRGREDQGLDYQFGSQSFHQGAVGPTSPPWRYLLCGKFLRMTRSAASRRSTMPSES
jgi:D-erythronate 2-dehydrogenase